MLKKIICVVGCLLGINLLLLVVQGCCRKSVCESRYGLSVHALDNGGLRPQETQQGKGVYARALLLNVKIDESEYYCSNGTMPELLGISSARAMCKATFDHYEQDSLSIYTDRDFDAGHAAGSNLLDLFRNKDEDYYLLAAPDDTSGTYRFTVKLSYKTKYNQDTAILATTAPLKLLK